MVNSNPDFIHTIPITVTLYSALIKNHTWTLVSALADSKIIGYKWVFTIKKNPNGTIQKYKARLVAKGYHQRQEVLILKKFLALLLNHPPLELSSP